MFSAQQPDSRLLWVARGRDRLRSVHNNEQLSVLRPSDCYVTMPEGSILLNGSIECYGNTRDTAEVET